METLSCECIFSREPDCTYLFYMTDLKSYTLNSTSLSDIYLVDIFLRAFLVDLFSCNFVDLYTCKWRQDNTDDFDWSRYSGLMASRKTGPTTDHTRGVGKRYVLLIEIYNHNFYNHYHCHGHYNHHDIHHH